MVDAISTSLSALSAATRKTSVAASNIANAGSVGTPGGGDGNAAYTPQDVINVTNGIGGVLTRVQNRDPAHVLAYDPDAPQADADGYIAVPNVDLVNEVITIKTAEIAYRASAKVIGVANRMQEDLQRLFDEKA